MTARIQSDPIGTALDSMATTAATRITSEQEQRARLTAARICQRLGYGADDLRTVLQALGLDDVPRKRIRTVTGDIAQKVLSPVAWSEHVGMDGGRYVLSLHLACGHTVTRRQDRIKPKYKTAVCDICTGKLTA